MKLPCMVIIFNKEMSDKLSCGIKCAFSAHAAMWLDRNMSDVNQENQYGESNPSDLHRCPDQSKYSEWVESDYRKLVMTSPETVESLFEKFKKSEVPVYMQRTSHPIKMLYTKFTLAEKQPAYPEGTPICLAVFCWKDEHKKLLEGMELM